MYDVVNRTTRAMCLACLCVAGCLAPLASALAQAERSAQELFEAGLDDMLNGRYASACPKLAESHRLDPVPGALFTLAECEAAWGKVATAIEHYQAFVDMLTSLPSSRRERYDERRRVALEKIAALSSTAPALTLQVPAEATDELLVKQDGVAVEAATYGVTKKLDPGRYTFSAEVEGRVVWQQTVALALNDRAQIDVPWPLGEPTPQTPQESQVEPVEAESQARMGGRPWFFVSAGAGAAGLVSGIAAGSLALAKKRTIEDHCPDRVCDAEGARAVDAGKRAAMISNVGFALGLAGAAAATTLALLQRRGARADAHARRGPRPGVLAQRGTIGLTLESVFR